MSVITFDFLSVPRIVFGVGKLSTLPTLTPPLGSTALVVYNGGDAPMQSVNSVLQSENIHLIPFRQKGEPTVAHIDAGLDLARREKCTGVIGIGGGSAIDAAKAIAGLLSNGGSALDYMEVIGRGQKITRPAAPWIAIPTTAGTGAEVTRNAVIGEPSRRFKASLRSELLLPQVAMVDPQLGLEVPRNVTAWSGMDALCQCIEAYTSTGAHFLTDGLALQGVALAAGALRAVFADGHDLAARTSMAAAALLSGIALTNAGLGAVHGFAAPLGANFPAPHGAICAALLPLVIEANIDALRAEPQAAGIARYAAIGRAFTGDPGLGDEQAVAALREGTQALVHDLQIPPLREFGLGASCVVEMVVLAQKASSMRFNPVVLSKEKLGQILTRAIEGTH